MPRYKPGVCSDCHKEPLPKGRRAGLCQKCKDQAKIRKQALRKSRMDAAERDIAEREARLLARGRFVPNG